MRVAKSLLASRGESKLRSSLTATFASVQGDWLPQVTFSELVEASREELQQLASPTFRDPYGWYLQTSVDLTFCRGSSVEPIFSIEFDGITHGFSRNGEFIRGSRSLDPKFGGRVEDQRREAKLDLKARMAAELGYPLVIIGWDELKSIGKKEALTIMDGIAAELIAATLIDRSREASAGGAGAARLEESEALTIRRYLADEQVRLEVDPFRRAAETMLQGLRADGVASERIQRRFLPEAPGIRAPELKARIAAQQAAKQVRTTVEIEIGPHQGTGSASMRNLWAPIDPKELALYPPEWLSSANLSVTGLPIAQNVTENIARYLALLDLWEKATSPP